MMTTISRLAATGFLISQAYRLSPAALVAPFEYGALPLAVFWFWLERSMIDREMADVSERHLLIARNLGAALERYQKDVKSGFELISQNLIDGREVGEVGHALKNLDFRQITVVKIPSRRIMHRVTVCGDRPV